MLDFLECSERGRLDHFDLAAAESLAMSSLRAMLQAGPYGSTAKKRRHMWKLWNFYAFQRILKDV